MAPTTIDNEKDLRVRVKQALAQLALTEEDAQAVIPKLIAEHSLFDE
jgi:hypothetical protein